MILDWERNNKYTIVNAQGQKVYHAYEDTDSLQLMCGGSGRGFTINIIDMYRQTVIVLRREANPCDKFGGSMLSVEAPPGKPVWNVRCSHDLKSY